MVCGGGQGGGSTRYGKRRERVAFIVIFCYTLFCTNIKICRKSERGFRQEGGLSGPEQEEYGGAANLLPRFDIDTYETKFLH